MQDKELSIQHVNITPKCKMKSSRETPDNKIETIIRRIRIR